MTVDKLIIYTILAAIITGYLLFSVLANIHEFIKEYGSR